jgi:PBP4 family serine-type D-alanyl-D-alanine carboxypeptidase
MHNGRLRIIGAAAVAIAIACGVALVEPLATAGAARRPRSAVPPSVSAAIANALGKPVYAHSAWGIAIRDLSSGRLLYGLHQGQLFVPGSLIKVFSTAAALRAYGAGYRFRTFVYRSGRMSRGALRGNLYLVAAGDFSMGLRERRNGTLAFNNAPVCDHNTADVANTCGLLRGNPLAALEALARQVRAAGIHRVEGNVVIDDRLFRAFDHWPDGLISPIWTNENVIDATTVATRPGRLAGVSWRPHVAGYLVRTAVRTVRPGSPTDLLINSETSGVIRVSGTIAAGSPPVVRISQIADPAAFARTAFVQALSRAGVAVSARVAAPNPAGLLSSSLYPRTSRVAEYASAPLAQFVKVILNVSYNRGAGLMVCVAAVHAGSRDCARGLRSVLANNTRLGVDPLSTYVFDGAGSVDSDRTTPADVTAFMRGASFQPWGRAFRDALPVLGRTGTLANVAADSPAAGHVQLKDGTRVAGTAITGQTLLTAYTLGGYVDAKSGRQLSIAIFVNNVPVKSLPAAHAVAEDEGAIAAAIQQAY